MAKTSTQRKLKQMKGEHWWKAALAVYAIKVGVQYIDRVDPLTSNKSPTWLPEPTSDTRTRVKELFSVEIKLPAPICKAISLTFCIEFPRLSTFFGKLNGTSPRTPGALT